MTGAEHMTAFLRLDATFAVPAYGELTVWARLQYPCARTTRVEIADAESWQIVRVRIGNRQVEILPANQRGDHFASAINDGSLELGVIQCAEDVELVVTPTRDDLLFSASFDGCCVRARAGES